MAMLADLRHEWSLLTIRSMADDSTSCSIINPVGLLGLFPWFSWFLLFYKIGRTDSSSYSFTADGLFTLSLVDQTKETRKLVFLLLRGGGVNPF